MTATRTEKDPLGPLEVPALYGVQTQRAVQNFPISGLRPLEPFVLGQVWIKKAAALTHKETGRMEPRLADAIVTAADEVLSGRYRDQFVVDPYQAGAGTSRTAPTSCSAPAGASTAPCTRTTTSTWRRARTTRSRPTSGSRACRSSRPSLGPWRCSAMSWPPGGRSSTTS